MRCKNCKTKIENPNLFRCPKCGKPLPKKKIIDKTELALNISFVAVSVIFVVFGVLSLAFACEFYSSTAIIIAVIAYIVLFPFTSGSFQQMKIENSEICAAIASLPFVANIVTTFIVKGAAVDFGGLSTFYFVFVLASLFAGDILLVLSAAHILKIQKIASWIMLGAGVVSIALTIVMFAVHPVVKGFAVAIVTVNSFTPMFVTFSTLYKHSRNKEV